MRRSIVKKTITVLAILLALVTFVGCVSEPAPAPAPAPTPVAVPPFQVLQHKGTTLGVAMPPPWIEKSLYGMAEVEKLYPDKYALVVDETGTNLDGLISWANNYSANNEIIKRINLRVQSKFAGALAGDKDKVGIYQEAVSKSVAEGTVNGFKKEADWWVQLRWFKPDKPSQMDREEFRYLVLYVIPKDMMDQKIQEALDGVVKQKPPSPEQATAMDKVKQAFYEGF